MQDMEKLQELILAHHTKKVNEVLETMQEWAEPFVVNGIPKHEWEEINEGMKSDIKKMVDYTNEHLTKHGYPPVVCPV